MKNNEMKAAWGQQMRLQFIDFRLKWEGKLNRQDIQDAFGISKPQSSLDLALYQDNFAENIKYDKSAKFYTPTEKFKEAFPSSSAENYLHVITMSSYTEKEFLNNHNHYTPPVEFPATPEKNINDSFFRFIVLALKFKKSLIIDYQSMSLSTPSTRTITPTSLCFDGNRWHVRAYCHLKKRYSDFVISRISSIIREAATPYIGVSDVEWDEYVTVELHPKKA